MTTAKEAVKAMNRKGVVMHFLPGERVTDAAIVARLMWLAFHLHGVSRMAVASC